MRTIVSCACVAAVVAFVMPVRADLPAPPPECGAVGDECTVASGGSARSPRLKGICVADTGGTQYCKIGDHCYKSGDYLDAERAKPPCSKLQLVQSKSAKSAASAESSQPADVTKSADSAKPAEKARSAEGGGCGGCAVRRSGSSAGVWLLLPLLLLLRRLR